MSCVRRELSKVTFFEKLSSPVLTRVNSFDILFTSSPSIYIYSTCAEKEYPVN